MTRAPEPVPDGSSEHLARPPWFDRRPRLAVALALLLFAGIFALRLGVGDSRDGISMLFVFPIALLAMTGGILPGTLGGVAAVALVVTWTALSGTHLSAIGWASRILPLLLVGGLIGDACDRRRRAEVESRRLESSVRLHRDAIEINDGLVQGMAAAKWALEAGRTATGIDILEDTLARGHQLVSALLRDADMSIAGDPGAAPGDQRRPLSPD
jgi:hypothetical protein